MTQFVPLFITPPGGLEMLIILFVVVLLFGANKVPKLARASGQALGEFKRGREDVEREIRAATESTPSTAAVTPAVASLAAVTPAAAPTAVEPTVAPTPAEVTAH